MKSLLTFSSLFVFFFSAFLFEEEAVNCSPDKAAAVHTIGKICDIGTGPVAYGCNMGTLSINVDQNCIGRGTATVRAVNLATNPVYGESYDLPDDTPDIYYEYHLDNSADTISIGPINSFTFYGEYFYYSHGTDSLPYFEFRADMEIDVSQICNTIPEVYEPMTVRLVDVSRALYPIDDYAKPVDIFYCAVFEETCDHCPWQSNCLGGGDPHYQVVACGSCNDCGSIQRSTDASDKELEMDESTESIANVSFQPNPFTDFITLQYDLNDKSEISVEIIDANGAVVHRLNTIQKLGEQSLKIDANHLENGIYFCRLKIGAEVFTEKIVKIK